VAFSPDGHRLASGSGLNLFGMVGEVKIWDLATGNLTLRGHGGEVFGLAFSPDGRRLASGSSDETVKVWDTTSGQELFTHKGHTSWVISVAFSPDGNYLASSSADRTAKLWNATADPHAPVRKKDTVMFLDVAFGSDGRQLWAAYEAVNGTGGVRELTSGQDVLTWGKTGEQLALGEGTAFSQEGRYFAGTRTDGGATVWDTATRRRLFTTPGHGPGIQQIALSRDGKQLAVSQEDRTMGRELGHIQVWNTATGSLSAFKVPEKVVTCMDFSPDGRLLAVGCRDGSLNLWAVTTGRVAVPLTGHSHWVRSVAFSPDGRRLVSSIGEMGVPAEIKVWDAETGIECFRLKGHRDMVSDAKFSGDGKRIVTGGADKTVRVWDSTTGQELLSLKGHAMMVNKVAFSPDGRRLGSIGVDGSLHVWEGLTKE
jgi:WD40 repeat protein